MPRCQEHLELAGCSGVEVHTLEFEPLVFHEQFQILEFPGNEPAVIVAVVSESEIVGIWRIAWTKEQSPTAGFAVEESGSEQVGLVAVQFVGSEKSAEEFGSEKADLGEQESVEHVSGPAELEVAGNEATAGVKVVESEHLVEEDLIFEGSCRTEQICQVVTLLIPAMLYLALVLA